MEPGYSAHQHGKDFRAKAESLLRQFTTWLVLASAGGITLGLKFITEAEHPAIALAALKPSLAAWLIALMAAASTVYLQYQENGWAGASFHAQGRREKQIARKADQERTADDRKLADVLAKKNETEARRYHQNSRLCMRAAQLTMLLSIGSFLFGAAHPIWAFDDDLLIRAVTK